MFCFVYKLNSLFYMNRAKKKIPSLALDNNILKKCTLDTYVRVYIFKIYDDDACVIKIVIKHTCAFVELLKYASASS